MKKMVTRLLAVVLCLAMVLSLAACGGVSDDKFLNESDPIQITDGAGRKVSFPEPAKKVATNWGGTVNPYLFALGLSDSIVAQNSKNKGIIGAMLPNFDEIPSVGSWSLDTEALANVDADVYIHSIEATDALKGANKVGIRSIGIKTNGYEDIIFNLNMLGKVFGVEDRAKEVIEHYESVLKIVEDHTATLTDEQKKTVVILGGDAGTVCKTSFEIELAGGKNCADALGDKGTERWPEAGKETILEWNPDFIFAQNKYAVENTETIMNDSTWAATNAVKNKNVYDIPCPFESWININMSDCLAILYMSMQMYPELYTDVNFEEVVIDYYSFVYGLEVDMELLNKDVN